MAKSSPSRDTNYLNYIMLIVLSFVLGALLSYLYFSGSGSVRCDQFHEPAFQGICYDNLAVDRLDPSLCAKVIGLGSVNGCFKDVAIASQDAAICARIDDGLMKDACYERVGAETKDKSVCDKIQDLSLRNGCYAEIGAAVITPSTTIPNTSSNTSTVVPPVSGQNPTPPMDPKMLSQKLSIPFAYTCGTGICFQIKADSTNKMAIDLQYLTYYVVNTPETIGWWDGGWPDTACTTKTTLGPGQNCFAKIDNVACRMNDKFSISIGGLPVATKEISGCPK